MSFITNKQQPSNEELKLDSLSHEFEKIAEKLRNFEDVQGDTIQHLIDELVVLQNEFKSNEECASTLSLVCKQRLQQKLSNVKDKISEIVKLHRDIHSAISKFGKSVDKNFVEDLSGLDSHFQKSTAIHLHNNHNHSHLAQQPLPGPLTEEENDEMMNLLILEHLLRQGCEEAAEQLIEESGIDSTVIDYPRFQHIGNIVSSIRRVDLQPVRKWLDERRASSSSQSGDICVDHSSRLEYLLCKLEFLEGVWREADNAEAVLKFARRLGPFAKDFEADFGRLMGSLIYLKRGLENTPYSSLSPGGPELQETVTEACQLVSRDVCLENQLTGDSPVNTAFASGCRALPRLHSLQKAIACLSKYGANNHVLPVSVDVDPSAHHHNIFHCPIIKEVAVGQNLPVRLMCGHAISRIAFDTLASADRHKVKCPYCPVDTNTRQVQDLVF